MAEMFGKEVKADSFASVYMMNFHNDGDSDKDDVITESGVYYNTKKEQFECWHVNAKGKRNLVTVIPERVVEAEKNNGNEKQLWNEALDQIRQYGLRLNNSKK